MAIGENALEFLKKEATVDERNVSHLTQKKYTEFMAQQGITKDLLNAYNEAQEELVNGMYLYDRDQLKGQISTAKKDGRDPSKEKAILTINTPAGNMQMEMTAAKKYPIPRQPGDSITKTAVASLTISNRRLMDKATCAQTEEDIKKALGI